MDRILKRLVCTCMTGCALTLGATVLPGWDSDFVAATNAANAANRPLVLFWANMGCEHCEALEKDVQSQTFTEWQVESGYLFCFVQGRGGKDPDGGTAAKNFAATAAGTRSNKLTSYPFVCLYWPKDDGSVSAASFATEQASTVMSKANALFAGYSPMPAYTGGDLAFTNNNEHARLEAEVGFTEYVDVPLVRAGAAAAHAAVNTFSATYGGAEILRNEVQWSAGESSRSVRVAIPGGASAGEQIAVTLYDDKGADRGSVGIHLVGPQKNSTKNPFFIGERTAQTLGYGEWTMDFDVAMEKFKNEPDSRLMAVASGSLWCPDCVMTDAHVLEKPEFKSWAVANKVILVDLDVPNFPNTTNSACLLTRVVGRTSDGYISGRGTLPANEQERYQSGAGYLSRHMVSDDAAAAVLARNRSLVGRNSLEGGWNNPDRKNQNRTGIPNFFALRRDGALTGTFETFDAIGPSEFKEAYLKRFSELVALCGDDAGELSNRCWQTTTDVFSGEGESAAATLSAIDLVDTYKLAAIDAAAAEQTVTVRGTDAGTTLAVSLIAVVDGDAKTLATETGALKDGVTVSGAIAKAGDFYVQITGTAAGTLAVDSDSADTRVAYSIEGSREPIENPYVNDWISKAADTTLPLCDAGGLAGTLTLSLKKTKKITANFSNGKKTLASFSGKWDADIALDGTAFAVLSKGRYALYLQMSGSGTIQAELSEDGTPVLSSGECQLADSFAEFSGVYLVAMPVVGDETTATAPSGVSYMTLKMAATASARRSGKFGYTVCLADGKTLSGTTHVTGFDANFGIVPVLKTSGADTLSALVRVRRNAASAPSRRAVVAVAGVPVRWSNTTAGLDFSQVCGVYGSYYDKSDSLVDAAGTSTVAWTADAADVADSAAYGALTGVAGYGSAIDVSAKKLALAQKTKGFTFSFNRTSGVFSGKTTLSFENKGKVSATYKGILLPGWFSDCACGEDDDTLIEMENIGFGAGFVLFSDKAGRKSFKRSFAAWLGSLPDGQ